MVEMQPENK